MASVGEYKVMDMPSWHRTYEVVDEDAPEGTSVSADGQTLTVPANMPVRRLTVRGSSPLSVWRDYRAGATPEAVELDPAEDHALLVEMYILPSDDPDQDFRIFWAGRRLRISPSWIPTRYFFAGYNVSGVFESLMTDAYYDSLVPHPSVDAFEQLSMATYSGEGSPPVRIGHALWIHDGTVYSMGENYSGVLGRTGFTGSFGTVTFSEPPNGIPIAICAGRYSSFIVMSDGSMWACGSNAYGQLNIEGLEHSTFDQVSTFTRSSVIEDAGQQVLWKSVSATPSLGYTVHAIDVNGHVWQWGQGSYENPIIYNRRVTLEGNPISDIVKVVTSHSGYGAALDANGVCYTWDVHGLATIIGYQVTNLRVTSYMTFVSNGVAYYVADYTVLAFPMFIRTFPHQSVPIWKLAMRGDNADVFVDVNDSLWLQTVSEPGTGIYGGNYYITQIPIEGYKVIDVELLSESITVKARKTVPIEPELFSGTTLTLQINTASGPRGWISGLEIDVSEITTEDSTSLTGFNLTGNHVEWIAAATIPNTAIQEATDKALARVSSGTVVPVEETTVSLIAGRPSDSTEPSDDGAGQPIPDPAPSVSASAAADTESINTNTIIFIVLGVVAFVAAVAGFVRWRQRMRLRDPPASGPAPPPPDNTS